MTRLWFSRGMRGMIAKRIQVDLVRVGCAGVPSQEFIDGDFGRQTEAAVRALQIKRKLPDTGAIDLMTWQLLTIDALPTLFQRCLGVIADFEGHGFGRARGNFDGAGLTWGVIGFTLKKGEIQALLTQAEKRVHDLLPRIMGPLAQEWADLQKQPLAAQMAWADAISVGPANTNIKPEWKQAFARLGEEPIIKYLQLEKAKQSYFLPASFSAHKLNLQTELGLAFAFDTQVQNGGFREEDLEAVRSFPATINEFEKRRRLAEIVASRASTQWQADVYKRKQILASGQGELHGRHYQLRAWGLDDSPVNI
jgi:hypothetical protein